MYKEETLFSENIFAWAFVTVLVGSATTLKASEAMDQELSVINGA